MALKTVLLFFVLACIMAYATAAPKDPFASLLGECRKENQKVNSCFNEFRQNRKTVPDCCSAADSFISRCFTLIQFFPQFIVTFPQANELKAFCAEAFAPPPPTIS